MVIHSALSVPSWTIFDVTVLRAAVPTTAPQLDGRAGVLVDAVGIVNVAGQREVEDAYGEAIIGLVKTEVCLATDVAAGPEATAVVTGGEAIAGRAGVVHRLLGLAPEGCNHVVALVLPVIVVLVVVDCRILDTALERSLAAHIGDFRACNGCRGICSRIADSRERILAAPLVHHAEGLCRGCAGGGNVHKGANVAAHYLKRGIIGLVNVRHGRCGHPDMPAPENGSLLVLGGDEGIAGVERLCHAEVNVSAFVCCGIDKALPGHFLNVVPGFPDHLYGIHFAHGVGGVTLESLNLVGSGGVWSMK